MMRPASHASGAGRNQHAVSGYVFTDKNFAKYLCPICQDFIQSPVFLKTCGHHFCQRCVQTWLQDRTMCPVCRATASSNALLKASMLQDSLNDMKVHCRNGVAAVHAGFTGSGSIGAEYSIRPGGCEMVVRLEDLEKHEKHCGHRVTELLESVERLSREKDQLRREKDQLCRHNEQLISEKALLETKLATPTTVKYRVNSPVYLHTGPYTTDDSRTLEIAAGTEVTDNGLALSQYRHEFLRKVTVSLDRGASAGWINDAYLKREVSPANAVVSNALDNLLNAYEGTARYASVNDHSKKFNLSQLGHTRFTDPLRLLRLLTYADAIGHSFSPQERQNVYTCSRDMFNSQGRTPSEDEELLALLAYLSRTGLLTNRQWDSNQQNLAALCRQHGLD